MQSTGLFMGIVLAASLCPAASAQPDIAGRATVIDGNTLEIHGERIRLHGIDAPESDQSCRTRDGEPYRCGQQASIALAELIGNKVVRCVEVDRDRYGHMVAKCEAGADDLSEWLAFNGWAVVYAHDSYDYVRAETFAKSDRRGIWRGRFVMPWDWRRGARLP